MSWALFMAALPALLAAVGGALVLAGAAVLLSPSRGRFAPGSLRGRAVSRSELTGVEETSRAAGEEPRQGALEPVLLLSLMGQLTRTGAGYGQALAALARTPGTPRAEATAMSRAAAALGLGLAWDQAWELAEGSHPEGKGGRGSASEPRAAHLAKGLFGRAGKTESSLHLPPASRRIRDAVRLAALTGAPARSSLEASAHSCQRLWKSTALAQAQQASVSILMPLALCFLPAFLVLGVGLFGLALLRGAQL